MIPKHIPKKDGDTKYNIFYFSGIVDDLRANTKREAKEDARPTAIKSFVKLNEHEETRLELKGVSY